MSAIHSVISFIKAQYKTESFIPLHVPYFGGNESAPHEIHIYIKEIK